MKDYETNPTLLPFGTKIYNATVSKKAIIGENCVIGNYVEIGPYVKIGDGCHIQAHAFIPQGVTIGNNVFIGPGVRFTNDKYPQAGNPNFVSQATYVEDNVTIGAGAVILPKITLHFGCLIGAGAVVTKSVAANQTAYGNPAKEVS